MRERPRQGRGGFRVSSPSPRGPGAGSRPRWIRSPCGLETPDATTPPARRQTVRTPAASGLGASRLTVGQDLYPARTYRNLDELCASCEYTYVYDPGTREWSAWHRTPRHIAD